MDFINLLFAVPHSGNQQTVSNHVPLVSQASLDYSGWWATNFCVGFPKSFRGKQLRLNLQLYLSQGIGTVNKYEHVAELH